MIVWFCHVPGEQRAAVAAACAKIKYFTVCFAIFATLEGVVHTQTEPFGFKTLMDIAVIMDIAETVF